MQLDFPDEDILAIVSDEEEWILWFDGASNMLGHGIGAILISPKGHYYPAASRLCFECTNNMAEYEACILGLQLALEYDARNLRVYGDSSLVINQVNKEWETRDAKLIPYFRHVQLMMKEFDKVSFHHIPRDDN